MRVALDATPLLGRPTGVGRYVAGLVGGLAGLPGGPELTLAAFTVRGAHDLPTLGGARVAGRRAPARLLQAAWARGDWPPVEWLAGRCDVFHATNFVLPPRRRAAGVVSVHDLSYALHAETVTPQVLRYRELVPRAVRAAQVVLTLTATVAEEVAGYYRLPPGRVQVARPGVDPAWAATEPPSAGWLAERGLPPRYLLAAGAVEPRKNLAVLVAAHERLQASDRETPPLVLVGPPGWGEPLRTGRGVVRAGWLDDPDLRRVVAGAALLAYPSRHEGFGLPPLEALACGVPAVVSDLPVLREVLGAQAVYVPVGDVDALAAALAATLADDGGPAARASRRAHAAAWTWQRCAREALAAYDLALDRHRSR